MKHKTTHPQLKKINPSQWSRQWSRIALGTGPLFEHSSHQRLVTTQNVGIVDGEQLNGQCECDMMSDIVRIRIPARLHIFILKLDLAVETKKIKLSHKCQKRNGTNHLPDPPLDVLEVITPKWLVAAPWFLLQNDVWFLQGGPLPVISRVVSYKSTCRGYNSSYPFIRPFKDNW